MATPLLAVSPADMETFVYTETWTPVFTAVLVATVRKWGPRTINT